LISLLNPLISPLNT